jgi:hypothetical protein
LVTLAAGGGLTRTLVVLLAGRRPLRAGTTLAAGGRPGRALVAVLAGAHVLIRRRLLPAGATLAAGGRLGRATLLPGHVRQPKRSDGPTIDPSAGLEALLALERDQGLPGARAEYAVGLADAEPLLDQDHLHLPDLVGAQTQCACPAADSRSAPAATEPGTASSHRDNGNDLAAAVNDDDVVPHHEVLVSAPLGVDLDQRRGHVDDPHSRRHRRANGKREVHVVDARHVAAGEHGLLNPGALLRRQIHSAASLTLLSLALLRLRLLGRTLLSLTWLALRLLSLTLGLLGLALLPLLALRGLPLRLIALPALALGLVTRSLTGGLVALAFPALLSLALLRLALLALFSLALRLACGLVAPLLGLALHALVTLALLTLIALALLRLPGGPVLLRLPFALGRALLALVLRALLCLAAAVLLLPLLRGAALGLSGAARLAAARRVLGGRHGNACRQHRCTDE